MKEIKTDIVVIGSGPGGSVTACTLAEAGRDVILLEEGSHFKQSDIQPFTLEEMINKYRCGGLTPTLGKPKVAYVEGKCVGGGSEINSGLYHRTPPEILERWQKEFETKNLSEPDLLPHFETCEKDVQVSDWPGQPPAASRKLQEGADQLKWKARAIPRWFRYNSNGNGTGVKQSMSETYIPRALKSGCNLYSETKATHISKSGSMWHVSATKKDGSQLSIKANTVFVSGGAIQTPTLLRRSGITRNIGQTLQLHPTSKIIAKYPEKINFKGMGVPVHQVKEFAPDFSFGGSISSPGYLALGFIDHPEAMKDILTSWEQMAVYYVNSRGAGLGTIRPIPFSVDPVVRYKLAAEDMTNLKEGMLKLANLLFESGAETLYPCFAKGMVVHKNDSIENIKTNFSAATANLMTIHLFFIMPHG